MIIFYLAYSGRNIIAKKSKGRTMSLQKLLGRYGWIGALVAPIIPFSENLIYITLGLTKYNPWNFAVSVRSEEHTSELQSLMRISYDVFLLKKHNTIPTYSENRS